MAAAEGAALVLLLDVALEDSELARLATSAGVVALTSVDDDRLKGSLLLLPVSTMAEENGTYMNRDGRVQRFTQAKAPPGMARPAWWIAAEAWSRREEGRVVPETAALAFAGLGGSIPAIAGVSYADLGVTGRVVSRESGARAESPAGAGSR